MDELALAFVPVPLDYALADKLRISRDADFAFVETNQFFFFRNANSDGVFQQ